MTKINTPPKTTPEPESAPDQKPIEETPFEATASICSVLVVGLYILTFLAQNFVIPSGSMEKTLLVGDHLVVDRITIAPSATWMPLVRYREPKRNDIVVFIKPGELDVEGRDDREPAIDRREPGVDVVLAGFAERCLPEGVEVARHLERGSVGAHLIDGHVGLGHGQSLGLARH